MIMCSVSVVNLFACLVCIIYFCCLDIYLLFNDHFIILEMFLITQVILQSETIQELTKTSEALALLQEEASGLRKLADAQKIENVKFHIVSIFSFTMFLFQYFNMNVVIVFFLFIFFCLKICRGVC